MKYITIILAAAVMAAACASPAIAKPKGNAYGWYKKHPVLISDWNYGLGSPPWLIRHR